MAVPRRRQCRSRRGKRRSHQGLRTPHITYCSQCGTAVPPHQVCPNCGSYHGRTVIEMEE